MLVASAKDAPAHLRGSPNSTQSEFPAAELVHRLLGKRDLVWSDDGPSIVRNGNELSGVPRFQ